MSKIVNKIFLFIGLASLYSISVHADHAAFHHNQKNIPISEAYVTLNDNKHADLHITISSECFIYKQKLSISSPYFSSEEIQVIFPESSKFYDPATGTVDVYEGIIHLPMKFTVPIESDNNTYLTLHAQGCSKEGICYPPEELYLSLQTDKTETAYSNQVSIDTHTSQEITDTQEPFFASWGIFMTFISFLGIGLLLAFSPCMFPMIPIVSGLILAEEKTCLVMDAKKQTTSPHKYRHFNLLLAYVLGIITTYTTVGIIAGMTGEFLSISLQKPIVLIISSVLMGLMGLSMLEWFTIQTPAVWKNCLNSLMIRPSLRSKTFGISIIRNFLLGILSSLILSPCIAPPIAGVILYIAQTGNWVWGGFTLFSLSLGMGLPYLVIGTYSKKYLPKSGPWLMMSKKILGISLIALAISIAQRVIIGPTILLVISFSLLLIYSSIKDELISPIGNSLKKICLMFSFIYLMGYCSNNTNIYHPLLQDKCTKINHISSSRIIEISTLQELQQQINNQDNIILTFHAHWCMICNRIEENIFQDQEISEKMNKYTILKVDLSKVTQEHKKIMQNLNIYGPPSTLFFYKGKELDKLRTIGYPKDFNSTLQNFETYIAENHFTNGADFTR